VSVLGGRVPPAFGEPLRFEFSTAGRIIFGAGTLVQAGSLLPGLGRRPLVVTGRRVQRARPLLDLLEKGGYDALVFSVGGEPDVDMVRQGTAAARDGGCDCVFGFGGGAALDAAKAIAILASNPGDVLDYLEIVGRGKTLTEEPLPLVAVPTTAGTGSEVTRNSVIVSREHRVKVSLRSPLMLPRVAVVDPELTYCLPPALTAATGLDALTQVIEPYVCTRANPFTDGLCREGMARVARSLRTAFAAAPRVAGTAAHPPSVIAAREDMAVASLFGGLALANAGLGAVHGIAGPLGGMIDAPHGAVCAALLPAVVAANLAALRDRDPDSPALPRYQEVAGLLTGDTAAAPEEAVEWLQDLVTGLGIPGLSAYGADQAVIGELVQNAARASSMRANPVPLTHEELAAIVEAAL
jgi:alcohol dehydrogenase class IV